VAATGPVVTAEMGVGRWEPAREGRDGGRGSGSGGGGESVAFLASFSGWEWSSGSGDGCASLSAAELSQVLVPMGNTDPVAAVGVGGGTLQQTCSSRLTSWIAALDASATRQRDGDAKRSAKPSNHAQWHGVCNGAL